MRVSRLAHTGLTVADLERSLGFYVGILGFDALQRRIIDKPWLAELIGADAAVVDAADLAVPGTDVVLQLFEFSVPSIAPASPGMPAPGSVPIAFVVDGTRALLDRLADTGVAPLAPPVVITSGPNTGGSLVCVRDPDGIIEEFYEASVPRTA